MKSRNTIVSVSFLFLANSSLACDCHGGGLSFGSFAGWAQMPAMNCIPSHASDNLGLGQEQTDIDDSDTQISEQAANTSEPEAGEPDDQSDS